MSPAVITAHIPQYSLTMLISTTISFIVLLFLKTISSSDGDERPTFLKCLETCPKECELSRVLRWTGWNCADDCKYRCMRSDVELIRGAMNISASNGDDMIKARIVQYYGKWPFVRVLGAQELFSVLFSLGNCLACLYGYFFIYRKTSKKEQRLAYMDKVHWIALWITCNAWIQSAIFHYRDTPFTEKLDYFSACLLILSTVPSAMIRIFEIKTSRSQLKLLLVMIGVYVQHVAYMSFVKFDYGYNVKFNACFGVLSNLLWIYWATFKQKNVNIRKETYKFVGGNVASMAMVAIDFPPFFDLIDMHALWHLSTIPITIMWYKFITVDANSVKNKKE